MKSIEWFKQYCIDLKIKYRYITPSMVVLKSFYVADIEKPKSVTVRQFDWLRSIAEKQLQTFTN